MKRRLLLQSGARLPIYCVRWRGNADKASDHLDETTENG